MDSDILKGLALWAVAKGTRVPEAQIDRFVELAHLKRLLEILQVNCVLDVGANIGQFAKELRGIGYTGRIVSFEPLRSEFDRLSRQFSADPHWRGHQIALGSEDRMMSINVARLTVMSSILQPVREVEGANTETIAVKRLDTLFRSLVDGIDTPRVFLKMDTQGYDVEVFKGAAGCLPDICGMQSELSVQPLYVGMPHYIDALRTYENAGYELYNLSAVNRVDDGGLLEMNCFMRRGA